MSLKIKHIFTLIVLLFFSGLAMGQYSSDANKDYEPMTNRERILLGVYVNSPFIAGNINGSQFGFGLQPFVGWRFNEFIASGAAFKFDYTYFWSLSGNQSFTDFSATVFTRATFANTLIFQVDAGIYSNQSIITSTQKVRNNFPVVYAGIGYSMGRTEIMLQYEVSQNLARFRLPFEYKIGFIFPL